MLTDAGPIGIRPARPLDRRPPGALSLWSVNIELDYTRLTTPPDDGDCLIEPPAHDWPALLDHNRHLQDHTSLSLAGREIRDVREATRAALLPNGGGRPIVACGHQPAFVHPGVWAKHVVVRQVSGPLGCDTIDWVVDNDAPADADLTVPVSINGLLHTQRTAFSIGPAGSAYEGRPRLDGPDLRRIGDAARTVETLLPGGMLAEYLNGFEQASAPGDFVDQHVMGRVRVDAALGASLHEMRVSRCFGGPFVADLLLNAPAFAGAYNRALQAYRRRERVRSPDRPLPDLGRLDDRTEAALWIYQPLQRRRRLWVELSGDRLRLFADRQPVGELRTADLLDNPDRALASLAPWVIRPRALTLTLWVRLLLCDLFVHGIGGAKYDRVTNDIFRTYYRCEPPAMACVSATLRLPLPRAAVQPGDLAAAIHRLRDLQFNPQRYLRAAPPPLLEERERLIVESQRLRDLRADRLDRRRVFLALREVNHRLVASEADLPDRFARRTDELRGQIASNATAASREFFYALQPRSRLEMLADRLQTACSRVS